jgi:dimethylhistidine N-methyltransferase
MRDALHMAHSAPMVLPHAARPLIALVFEGLSEEPKQLPPTLAFDPAGSTHYDELRAQPEHYLGRAEDQLLWRHAGVLAELAGPRVALVDYGSGDGRQARLLLTALAGVVGYVPIDIEASQLKFARERMRRCKTNVPVHPMCQDLRDHVALPLAANGAERRVALLGGLPFDGFRPLEAVAVLNSIREAMGPNGGLVVGVDLRKEPARMLRAYDDAAGRAAAFNHNILQRLNRELDATFDPLAYEHRVRWNEEQQRIEIALVSREAQVPQVAGIGVPIAAGGEIVTQHCYKYTHEGFATLARIAGWAILESWTDADSQYRLYYLASAE